MNASLNRIVARFGAVALLASLAFPQVGPGQVPGNWNIDDDGSFNVGTNIAGARTYRVGNDGVDGLILVVVREANNNVILPIIKIEMGADKDIGVPDGGDIIVLDGDGPADPNPGNSDGATGTFQTV